MKITIETDGHYKTTAECNGITAESLCNPTDAFKLTKGVHMAVQRLLDKLEEHEEDTGFHVGDIVEVVGTHTQFLQESVGLQGKVKRYDKRDDMCLVTLPIECGGNSNWWYHKSELKLLSKEDTGFHVGDIVEVLGTNTPFLKESVGLQGKAVRYDKRDGMWLIVLPIAFEAYDNWWYYESELKLIRRGKK